MRVMIAEDQPLLRERLAGLLAQAGCTIVAQHADGVSASRWLKEHPGAVDAMFLDIRIPGVSGLEVAAREPRVPAVFVTAFAEYAVDAWEHQAADYLLKPVTADRVRQAVERIGKRMATGCP
jgi:DNA-binding LytR/AlgR family response regulator